MEDGYDDRFIDVNNGNRQYHKATFICIWMLIFILFHIDMLIQDMFPEDNYVIYPNKQMNVHGRPYIQQ